MKPQNQEEKLIESGSGSVQSEQKEKIAPAPAGVRPKDAYYRQIYIKGDVNAIGFEGSAAPVSYYTNNPQASAGPVPSWYEAEEPYVPFGLTVRELQPYRTEETCICWPSGRRANAFPFVHPDWTATKPVIHPSGKISFVIHPRVAISQPNGFFQETIERVYFDVKMPPVLVKYGINATAYAESMQELNRAYSAYQRAAKELASCISLQRWSTCLGCCCSALFFVGCCIAGFQGSKEATIFQTQFLDYRRQTLERLNNSLWKDTSVQLEAAEFLVDTTCCLNESPLDLFVAPLRLTFNPQASAATPSLQNVRTQVLVAAAPQLVPASYVQVVPVQAVSVQVVPVGPPVPGPASS